MNIHKDCADDYQCHNGHELTIEMNERKNNPAPGVEDEKKHNLKNGITKEVKEEDIICKRCNKLITEREISRGIYNCSNEEC